MVEHVFSAYRICCVLWQVVSYATWLIFQEAIKQCTIMKTTFSKENNLGTFVAFLAEGYPSGARLEKFCNSSRAAGNKSGKVCRARLKSMDVDGRLTFWTFEPHPALP